jgi:metallo-beta-lactamase superfamily protein
VSVQVALIKARWQLNSAQHSAEGSLRVLRVTRRLPCAGRAATCRRQALPRDERVVDSTPTKRVLQLIASGAPGKLRALPRRRALEIAPDVFWLSVGGANVYFVRSASAWVLIDTGGATSARTIRLAAEQESGSTPPAAILLTHCHPDHAGSAAELSHLWNTSIYVHPDEMPLALDPCVSTVECYANPLDRWLTAGFTSLRGALPHHPAPAPPPRISTWCWLASKASVKRLADLEPQRDCDWARYADEREGRGRYASRLRGPFCSLRAK